MPMLALGPIESSRFTEVVLHSVLKYAGQESERLDHDDIKDVHILAGLMIDAAGVAVEFLQTRCGVEFKRLMEEIQRVVPPQSIRWTSFQRYSKDGFAVLQRAAKYADDLGHSQAGTEHLLLALLDDSESAVAQVFKGLGLDFAETRRMFRKMMKVR